MKTLAVPDLHCPHHHPAAMDFLADVLRAERPDQVVCIGDEIDAHAMSRYPADPDQLSAGHELQAAKESLKPFFRLFGRRQVRVCTSNHTWRPYKKAFAAGLPSACMRSIGDVLGAPKGWTWADFHEVDGTLYVHGEGFGKHDAAYTAATRYRRSVVIGHVHAAAGALYSADLDGKTIFGLSTGCLINPAAAVFAYAKYTPNRPVLGCGLVDHGIPVWIPLQNA